MAILTGSTMGLSTDGFNERVGVCNNLETVLKTRWEAVVDSGRF